MERRMVMTVMNREYIEVKSPMDEKIIKEFIEVSYGEKDEQILICKLCGKKLLTDYGYGFVYPSSCEHFFWRTWGNTCFSCHGYNLNSREECPIGCNPRICFRAYEERLWTAEGRTTVYTLHFASKEVEKQIEERAGRINRKNTEAGGLKNE